MCVNRRDVFFKGFVPFGFGVVGIFIFFFISRPPRAEKRNETIDSFIERNELPTHVRPRFVADNAYFIIAFAFKKTDGVTSDRNPLVPTGFFRAFVHEILMPSAIFEIGVRYALRVFGMVFKLIAFSV